MHFNANTMFDKLFKKAGDEELYAKVAEHQQHQKLKGLFEEKPFFERTATLAGVFAVVGLVCNIASGVTEFIYLDFALDKMFVHLPTVALGAAVILALAIELVKANILPSTIRKYFARSEIDKMNVVIYSIAVALSLVFSFKGSAVLTEVITPPPTLLSTDSVTAHYDALIAKKEQEVKDFKRSNSYKGKILAESRPAYNVLVTAKTKLEQDKQAALDATTGKNEATLTGHEQQVTSEGTQLGWITVGSEVIFLALTTFLQFRHYRRYIDVFGKDYFKTETVSQNSKSAKTVVTQQSQPIFATPHQPAFSRNETREPRQPIGFRYGQNTTEPVTQSPETVSQVETVSQKPKATKVTALSSHLLGLRREVNNLVNGNGKRESVLNRIDNHLDGINATLESFEAFHPEEVNKVINYFCDVIIPAFKDQKIEHEHLTELVQRLLQVQLYE